MKALRVLLLAALFPFALNAQPNSLDSLQKIAQAQNKKVFLYFSGSDWCGPCIKFKKVYMNAPEFQEFSKNNLLLLNADFPRKGSNQLSKEKTKENEALAEQYNPNGNFPLIILLDNRGKILRKWEGFPKETVSEFIKKLY